MLGLTDVRARAGLWACWIVLAACVAGCSGATTGTDGGDARGSIDALDTAIDNSPPPECTNDEGCSDGMYCNGEERCVGGRCVPGVAPCDDRRSCSGDICNEMMRSCEHTYDHAMCADPDACNGAERCDPSASNSDGITGCTPVRRDNVIDCDDGNTCTIDACDTTIGCIHAPRDLDGDGHVDRACTVDGTPFGPPGDDCNDGDATAFPGALEVCDDRRDNNCNGQTDFAEVGVCAPTNDTCASATVLPGPGTYWGSTVGLRDDYALGCNTGSYADSIFQFTLTEPQDVTIGTSGGDTSGNAAISLLSNCMPYTEVRCNRAAGFGGGAPTIRVRSLPAGTYQIVAETGSVGAAFRLTLRYDPPTTTPLEEVCPSPEPGMAVELNDGMPHVAMLGTLEDDYTLSCNTFDPSRDAVFRLTLAAAADVRITAVPEGGGFGSTYLSFRGSPCAADASERRCYSSFSTTGLAVTQRSLAAGTYWVIVEHSENANVTVTATVTSPPLPTVTYTASNPTGVAFVDACATMGATTVLPNVDDSTASVPLSSIPFPVRVYNQNLTTPLTISSNGYIVAGPSGSFPLSGSVPEMGEPNLTIAAYWRDLLTSGTGICYVATGTAPNRQFIVQWQGAGHCCGRPYTQDLTFEIVINEAAAGANNVIDLIYQTMTGSSTAGAGIENEDGTVGTTVTGAFTTPRVVRLTPSS